VGAIHLLCCCFYKTKPETHKLLTKNCQSYSYSHDVSMSSIQSINAISQSMSINQLYVAWMQKARVLAGCCCLQRALQAGADPNLADRRGDTPLCIAAGLGLSSIVRLAQLACAAGCCPAAGC
jgi:ankyrin repeat protein